MIKRTLILLSLLVACKITTAQQAAYNFPLPQGWDHESMALPIQFAPAIPITGTEDIRFTPGWGKSTTDDYWSYTFLWFINGIPTYKADTLESYLTQYYNGLYLLNLKNKQNAPTNFTHASIKKVHALATDQQTFEGKISTLDFLTGQPITFYARIHVRNYPAIGRTAVLNEISPKDYKNVVWDKLDGIVNGFTITKQ